MVRATPLAAGAGPTSGLHRGTDGFSLKKPVFPAGRELV
jgi:hypothetical protein